MHWLPNVPGSTAPKASGAVGRWAAQPSDQRFHKQPGVCDPDAALLVTECLKFAPFSAGGSQVCVQAGLLAGVVGNYFSFSSLLHIHYQMSITCLKLLQGFRQTFTRFG